MKNILSFLILLFFSCSSSSEQINCELVAKQFVDKNTGVDFDKFQKFAIPSERFEIKYDPKQNKNLLKFNSIYFYDSYSKEFRIINLDSIHTYDFASNVYKEYLKINVPETLKIDKIKIEGNPEIGDFITVNLNSNCRLYKKTGTHKLPTFWEKKFMTLKKVNDNWYYEYLPTKTE